MKSISMQKISRFLFTYKKLFFQLCKAITPNLGRILKNEKTGPPWFFISYRLKQKLSNLVHSVKSYYKSTVVLKGVVVEILEAVSIFHGHF